MKNTWKVAVAAAALMGSASVAKADITLSGPTGLFLNPTAQIAPKDAPEVAVDYQRYSEDGFHSNAIGIAGAIQLADKLEVNGGFHHFGGDSDFGQWNIGAKYRIMSQSEKGIGVWLAPIIRRLPMVADTTLMCMPRAPKLLMSTMAAHRFRELWVCATMIMMAETAKWMFLPALPCR